MKEELKYQKISDEEAVQEMRKRLNEMKKLLTEIRELLKLAGA
ncbi:MAG: hypothetical protein QXE76_00510 [Candidatus Bathyarchaeia archaeon]